MNYNFDFVLSIAICMSSHRYVTLKTIKKAYKRLFLEFLPHPSPQLLSCEVGESALIFLNRLREHAKVYSVSKFCKKFTKET